MTRLYAAADGPGAAQRLLVTSTDAAGREQDRTFNCQIRSFDPAIARIERTQVIAVAPGDVEIQASCDAAETSIVVHVGNQPAGAMQIDFTRDLLSILTTKGCNGSSCHGSPAGQAGFKLSLYGADPAADHRMIVQAADGRRVDLQKPAESLFLQKPTFAIAHGGGQLMTPDEDEYGTLLAWIEQGATFSSTGAQLERLEIHPPERILVGEGAAQTLVVVGRLSDGATRDMTEQVKFSVADTGVVSDVVEASVTAKVRGLTTVLARALGKTAAAQFIVVHDVPTIETQQPSNFIDRHVFDKLRRVGIQPYEPSSDRVFIRRVFLDAIGVLPTPAEVDAFRTRQA